MNDPIPIAPLERYLESSHVIDWWTPSVRDCARDLVGGTKSDVAQATVLFEWVRDTIPHSGDIGSEAVTCTASEVLGARTGICYAKSHLLAALLRASSIPAGFCYQLFERDAPYTGRALHGLNALYLPSRGRWFRVDCRGNKEGVDAQLDLERERIAFPGDELFDDNVYPEPFPSVVRALRAARSRTELEGVLPDSPA